MHVRRKNAKDANEKILNTTAEQHGQLPAAEEDVESLMEEKHNQLPAADEDVESQREKQHGQLPAAGQHRQLAEVEQYSWLPAAEEFVHSINAYEAELFGQSTNFDQHQIPSGELYCQSASVKQREDFSDVVLYVDSLNIYVITTEVISTDINMSRPDPMLDSVLSETLHGCYDGLFNHDAEAFVPMKAHEIVDSGCLLLRDNEMVITSSDNACDQSENDVVYNEEAGTIFKTFQ